MNQSFENLSRADVVVSYKAKFSLIALWSFAVIVFVLMVLFNSSSINSNKSLSDGYLNLFYSAGNVNPEMSIVKQSRITKKFFLTRLPSSQSENELKVENQPIQVLVIRKAKMAKSKSTDGFQIKPIPQ